MTVMHALTKRSGALYALYSVVVLATYFAAMHVWKLNGVFVEQQITYEQYTQAVATYSLGVLLLPWAIVSFQALAVWLVSLTQAGTLTYRMIWKAVFWTYLIPVASRAVLSNLILLLASQPTQVSFGLGLLVPVPLWLDRTSDLFSLGQFYLFFTFFAPEGGLTKKQRWWLTGSLVLATIISIILV